MAAKFVTALLGRIASAVGVTRDDLSLSAALKRCRGRGVRVETIIDVGASDGRWSLEARKFFPQAFCFLIEAQEAHRAALETVKKRVPRVDFVIAAAGSRAGTCYFDAEDLFGGLASETEVGTHCISVPMVTIDDQVLLRNLAAPFLLKLDTHGFELPILQGAKQALASASLVIIETYNFRLTHDSLKFHEMCAYMEEAGFSCVDLVRPMHRPGDQAFWQMDLVFARSSDPVFSSNSYLPPGDSL
ncbi:SAM-dependent methyltransferase, FkbM family [Citrifermentans bemidjiense Bem]|uniref:SAM-dependent methyltransferase, FkbM family n=1 Tax=Citrifermentans bemidjiense (strain ATCC BAA-1014 / DSM 16622 / JCM 12645 / Bem) TaxID=404380 RepID=B5EGT9_CITBB|nr:FkbM family methyltransferase [Citrifermentans bemidjiense]ACH39572.1 SAM-dependent methyltransferase, FkbM family [Citrifermentans bemidjiense Bem]